MAETKPNIASPLGALSFAEAREWVRQLPAELHNIPDKLVHLENAFRLPLPGPPDEAWRRIDIEQFHIEKMVVTVPLISVETDGPDPGANGSGRIEAVTLEDIAGDTQRRYATFHSRFAAAFERRRKKNKSRANDVEENKLYSYNQALSESGVFVYVPKDYQGENTLIIRLESPAADGVALPQLHIHVAPGASVDILLDVRCAPNASLWSSLKALVEEDGELGLATVQTASPEAFAVQHRFVIAGENAHVYLDDVALGGHVSMVDSTCTLAGAGAHLNAYGLMATEGQEHSGVKVSVEHHAEHTKSDTFYKAVLRDASRALFSGNIKIPQGSVHSVGYEENRSLLLGEDARSESIPQLEIIENDVSCSHGSTVSSLDPEELYYLGSRGIPHSQAERLLVKAFYADILGKMRLGADGSVRAAVIDAVRERTGIEID